MKKLVETEKHVAYGLEGGFIATFVKDARIVENAREYWRRKVATLRERPDADPAELAYAEKMSALLAEDTSTEVPEDAAATAFAGILAVEGEEEAPEGEGE